jgi:hypothetical protein
MKTFIKNLKQEIKLKQNLLKNAEKLQLNKDRISGEIYGLKTALIFAQEGVDSYTIVRWGK